MKKKLLVLLLIITVAAFVFTGCTPPTPSEGEGEGEGELEGVVFEIDGAYNEGGITYVKGGETYDLTVTFPAPVDNVIACFSCVGEFAKQPLIGGCDSVPILFSEDNVTWTGKVNFDCYYDCNGDTCTVGYLWVEAGDCDWCLYSIPVVVDYDAPYATLKITTSSKDCYCGGCAIKVTSITEEVLCDEDVACCGDYCSGFAGWSVRIFDKYPWNVCCDTSCEEPIFTASDSKCPIEFVTPCLTEDKTYYAILELEDNVGNKVTFAEAFKLDTSCGLDFVEIEIPDKCDFDYPECATEKDGAWYIVFDDDEKMDDDCWVCGY